jgi:predicted transcriptional regulator
MAYYSISMNNVKQIFQLRQQGVSIKKIAAILGISKNTVKSYLRKTDGLDFPENALLATSNPQDYLKPVANKEKVNYQDFLARAEYYAQELSNRRKTHVTCNKICLMGRRFCGWSCSFEIFQILLSPPAVFEK